MQTNDFGENLKYIRQKRNMTQKELAKEMGICPQSISKWETGEVTPQVRWVYRLAEILKVNPKSLI